MFIFIRSEVYTEFADYLEPPFCFPKITVSRPYKSYGQAMREAEQDMCDWLDDDEELIRRADIFAPPADDKFLIEYTDYEHEETLGRIIWEVVEVKEDD